MYRELDKETVSVVSMERVKESWGDIAENFVEEITGSSLLGKAAKVVATVVEYSPVGLVFKALGAIGRFFGL